MVYLSTNKTGRTGAKDTHPALTKQPKEVAVMADSKVRNSTEEEKEVWKPIPGFEQRYKVSNKGRIRSKKYVVIRSNGDPYTVSAKVKKLHQTRDGYLSVDLYKEKTRYKGNVHRIVAEAFILNPEDKPEVNHKDSNRQNNNVQNLEWVSRQENRDHATRKGSYKWDKKRIKSMRGGSNPSSKLDKEKIRKIRSLYDDGLYQEQIAKKFNVSQHCISSIITGKTWSHV